MLANAKPMQIEMIVLKANPPKGDEASRTPA